MCGILQTIMAGSRKGIDNKAKKAVELLKEGKVLDTKTAMEVAGYSASSIASNTIGRTKEYQEYLKTIDDVAITESWKGYAMDIENATDKRLAYDMGKELVKIKDRNPDVRDNHKANMPILNMVFKGDVSIEEIEEGGGR